MGPSGTQTISTGGVENAPLEVAVLTGTAVKSRKLHKTQSLKVYKATNQQIYLS